MCRRNRRNGPAWLCIAVGTLVLLALVLPRWLWVLVCGCSLIAGGIMLICGRR